MAKRATWDFRDKQELILCDAYQRDGYVIERADYKYLELLKKDIEEGFLGYLGGSNSDHISLENAHNVVKNEDSNNLRLWMMNTLFNGTEFHQNYYRAAKEVIHRLCGNELAMQKRPGISINFPDNEGDVLPIHADTWNGVSPFELNIWLPFVNCHDSMCLYILKREKYERRLRESKGLLKLSSDELFDELKSELTWIDVEYGNILAFDQSLPHGYSINKESTSHWSMNCRFKGLHTPYWDKKLGEYFMPITVKNCTRLGMDYKHPVDWV